MACRTRGTCLCSYQYWRLTPSQSKLDADLGEVGILWLILCGLATCLAIICNIRKKMKATGIVLLVLGALAFFVGFNMDTSVATLGDRRVHNIGLMNDRQNFIIFAAVLAVIGAIFVGRSGPNKNGKIGREDSVDSYAENRKCPFCAESVKADAVICRFCQKDLPPNSESTRNADVALAPAPSVKVGKWNYVAIGFGVFALIFGLLLPVVNGTFTGSHLPSAFLWVGLITYCSRNILRAKKKS